MSDAETLRRISYSQSMKTMLQTPAGEWLKNYLVSLKIRATSANMLPCSELETAGHRARFAMAGEILHEIDQVCEFEGQQRREAQVAEHSDEFTTLR